MENNIDNILIANGTEQFSIFGAGMVASSVAEILFVKRGVLPFCFVVSDTAINPRMVMERPVVSWDDYSRIKKDNEMLLIAIPEPLQEEIEEKCRRANIAYRCITSEVENMLLYDYYSLGARFPVWDSSKEIAQHQNASSECKIYMACGPWDKSLKRSYEISGFMYPIQAGKALSDIRIADIGDDTGNNISDRNPYYCELTALYWIWKNTGNDYAGLCHYRRWFVFRDKELPQMLDRGGDVILPYPSIQYPNAAVHEKRYISCAVRQVIREVLAECSVQEMQSYEALLEDRYIYNFNMLIAKKKVLDDYCEWLFNIIFEVEQRCIEKQIVIEKRQQGYWGEVLLSYYFMKKRTDLKVIHIGRTILI